jgi:hypothetical protein
VRVGIGRGALGAPARAQVSRARGRRERARTRVVPGAHHVKFLSLAVHAVSICIHKVEVVSKRKEGPGEGCRHKSTACAFCLRRWHEVALNSFSSLFPQPRPGTKLGCFSMLFFLATFCTCVRQTFFILPQWGKKWVIPSVPTSDADPSYSAAKSIFSRRIGEEPRERQSHDC